MNYEDLRHELRVTLSQTGKWDALPELLDALDRQRRESARGSGASGAIVRTLWVDRFAGALLAAEPVVGERRAVEAAHALWPWMGDYDPEVLAQGHWDGLPRNCA